MIPVKPHQTALARGVLMSWNNNDDNQVAEVSMIKFSNAPTIAFCFSLTALMTGCGATATISRANAPELDAQIVGSDPHTIYVKTEGGTTMSVARDSITEIDHPGNVAATIGGIVTGYGIVNIASGASDCDRYGAAYCTGVFLPAAIGAPIMAYGLYRWINSTTAAKGDEQKQERSLAIVPTVSVDKKNEYVGVTAAMRF